LQRIVIGESPMSPRRSFWPRLVPGRRERQDAETTQADEFRRVMLPHMDAAYSFACYLARNPLTAEDIVQDAFLRALRGFGGWRGDNAKAWLLAIVRNCYLDTVVGRRDPLRGAEDVEAIDACETLATEEESLEAQAVRQSEALMLRRTIENLPEPFRETLVLRELEELSYKEIAAITEVPIGTVMSRLARARTMLGALLLPPADELREAQS
jgi:RNA polymerase sigma factor (sigma-70 family)